MALLFPVSESFMFEILG